ncbi:MAG TPA: hypothetical protein VK458_02515, partial [Myxococcaceae bacterium]|nr:hypothetical protein [Myxococcaceae bacterium]
RQRQIDWIKARADTMKQLSLGSALIITSPVARMTLSIVLHFSQAASRLHAAGLVKEAQRVRTHYGLNPQHSTA